MPTELMPIKELNLHPDEINELYEPYKQLYENGIVLYKLENIDDYVEKVNKDKKRKNAMFQSSFCEEQMIFNVFTKKECYKKK